jgi:hypothetical protein
VLIVAIILLVMLVAPDAKAQQGEMSDEISVATDEASLQDLVQIFQQVGVEITDPDIKEYYTKLISEYQLSENSNDNTLPESTDGQVLLPDIRKIQETALTLPFQEAGKKIHDREIRDFYYKFLNDTGLSSESPSGG